MAQKERNNLVSPSDGWLKVSYCNNVPIVNIRQPATTPCVGSYEAIDSVDTGVFIPNIFRANPVTIVKGVGSCSSGIITGGCGDGYPYRDSYVGQFQQYRNRMSTGIWDAGLADESFVKANAKLKDAEFNLSVFIGEASETVELLRNPIRALTDEVKKISKRKNGSFLNILSGGWLTYRYGILPLIADVNAAIALVSKGLNRSVSKMTSKRATARRTTTPYTARVPVAGGELRWMSEETEKFVVESTSIIYFQCLMETQAELVTRILGLHPSQWPSNAWELIRFSFVVDWFYAVGQWLQAITPTPWIALNGNCTSQKITVEYTANAVAPSHNYGSITEFAPSNYTWTCNTLIRRVNQRVPVLPPVRANALNLKRTLDSFSLLWLNMSRRRT